MEETGFSQQLGPENQNLLQGRHNAVSQSNSKLPLPKLPGSFVSNTTTKQKVSPTGDLIY